MLQLHFGLLWEDCWEIVNRHAKNASWWSILSKILLLIECNMGVVQLADGENRAIRCFAFVLWTFCWSKRLWKNASWQSWVTKLELTGSWACGTLTNWRLSLLFLSESDVSDVFFADFFFDDLDGLTFCNIVIISFRSFRVAISQAVSYCWKSYKTNIKHLTLSNKGIFH